MNCRATMVLRFDRKPATNQFQPFSHDGKAGPDLGVVLPNTNGALLRESLASVYFEVHMWSLARRRNHTVTAGPTYCISYFTNSAASSLGPFGTATSRKNSSIFPAGVNEMIIRAG